MQHLDKEGVAINRFVVFEDIVDQRSVLLGTSLGERSPFYVQHSKLDGITQVHSSLSMDMTHAGYSAEGRG